VRAIVRAFLYPKMSGVQNRTLPGCKAYFLSKAKRRHTPGKHTTRDPHSAGALKRDDILPRDKTSMDQFTRGHEKDIEQYVGAKFFVDHASGLIITSHQPTLGSGDTLGLLGRMKNGVA
jgi:hypothetical protein